MIIAGEICGRYAAKHGLPMPFRIQAQAVSRTSDIKPANNEYVNFLRDIRDIPPSKTSLEPRPHLAMGLPVYVRVTSPMRRYLDLLSHYQLKAHLSKGAYAYSAYQLQDILEQSRGLEEHMAALQRGFVRFSSLKTIAHTSKKDEVFEALLIHRFALLPMQDVEEVFLFIKRFSMKVKALLSHRHAVGDTLYVKVVQVDPYANLLRLRVVD